MKALAAYHLVRWELREDSAKGRKRAEELARKLLAEHPDCVLADQVQELFARYGQTKKSSGRKAPR
jgi:hypothetical protein